MRLDVRESNSPEAFLAEYDVPRGTIDRLITYERLLRDWQQRMNLIGPATVDRIWFRHFVDSAQLTALIEPGLAWVDIGAGGGFPGLVLATMDWGTFTLVDSVAKKCRFLEAVVAELRLSNVQIKCARIEELPCVGADVATARAAAPLARLFEWSLPHVQAGGQFVFPKGRNHALEVEEAEKHFAFDRELVQSRTDRDARIIVARNVRRVR